MYTYVCKHAHHPLSEPYARICVHAYTQARMKRMHNFVHGIVDADLFLRRLYMFCCSFTWCFDRQRAPKHRPTYYAPCFGDSPNWAAAKKLTLSYHDRDINKTIGFLDIHDLIREERSPNYRKPPQLFPRTSTAGLLCCNGWPLPVQGAAYSR